MEDIIHMKKHSLFVLFITIALLTACSGNDENNSPKDNVTPPESNNENELNTDNTNDNENENENEEDGNEFALVDVSLDISEGIEEAYHFFDELYFSNTAIVDEEIGLKSAEVTVHLDDSFQTTATLRAYTIEPQNTFHLSVDVNPDSFEDKLTKTDADGNDMAVEVADAAYEFAGDLIWKKDNHVYKLAGGRSVVSTNKDNEIHPEADRLLFYENLIPTNDELKTYDAFYRNVLVPTKLPEGFSLYRFNISYEQPQGLSQQPPAKSFYQVKGEKGETILFQVYGEYDEAPKLLGNDVREEVILETTVQINEELMSFELTDVTYQISSRGLPEETVLEIAASIIEQAA